MDKFITWGSHSRPYYTPKKEVEILVSELKIGEMFKKNKTNTLIFYYDGDLKYHTTLINRFDEVFENKNIKVLVKR